MRADNFNVSCGSVIRTTSSRGSKIACSLDGRQKGIS
jgi:hypothetical protein